jgi:hypothetical protein
VGGRDHKRLAEFPSWELYLRCFLDRETSSSVPLIGLPKKAFKASMANGRPFEICHYSKDRADLKVGWRARYRAEAGYSNEIE